MLSGQPHPVHSATSIHCVFQACVRIKKQRPVTWLAAHVIGNLPFSATPRDPVIAKTITSPSQAISSRRKSPWFRVQRRPSLTCTAHSMPFRLRQTSMKERRWGPSRYRGPARLQATDIMPFMQVCRPHPHAPVPASRAAAALSPAALRGPATQARQRGLLPCLLIRLAPAELLLDAPKLVIPACMPCCSKTPRFGHNNAAWSRATHYVISGNPAAQGASTPPQHTHHLSPATLITLSSSSRACAHLGVVVLILLAPAPRLLYLCLVQLLHCQIRPPECQHAGLEMMMHKCNPFIHAWSVHGAPKLGAARRMRAPHASKPCADPERQTGHTLKPPALPSRFVSTVPGLGPLHMLQVLRRAQLVLPQPLHVQSPSANRPGAQATPQGLDPEIYNPRVMEELLNVTTPNGNKPGHCSPVKSHTAEAACRGTWGQPMQSSRVHSKGICVGASPGGPCGAAVTRPRPRPSPRPPPLPS